MAKKVIVNIGKVKQPKDVSTHFKFKKVAKWENIKLVKKSKTH